MIKQIAQAAVLVACGLALGGCPFEQAKTAAPAKRPPAPDYQMAGPPSPPAAQIRNICFNEADITTFRSRMVAQELVVGVLQCQGAGGVRLFDRQWADFNAKFGNELRSNGEAMKGLTNRKRRNLDVTVTEIANRTAQRASTDPEFCSRMLRGLEWSLAPQATSLAQVPAPYDVGPEMNIHPCPAQ